MQLGALEMLATRARGTFNWHRAGIKLSAVMGVPLVVDVNRSKKF